MEKKVHLGLLMDQYAPLLTRHQRLLMEMYCNEDYSLAEIAQLEGISRQGVRDALVRAERSLTALEQRLHLVARHEALRGGLGRIMEEMDAQGLKEYSGRIEALLRTWEE